MRIFYRISDNSYKKPKLPGATKRNCYSNFLQAFEEVFFKPSVVTIIADNCVESLNIDFQTAILTTNLGNAKSLRKAIYMALRNDVNDLEIFYFVEDDYLHKKKANLLIEEGLELADYVTLYDHPDKYTSFYDYGETSKVLRTEHSHWRYTVSTCMTFGTKAKVLKEDLDIWWKYTEGSHPQDHHIFQELAKKGRKLAVCIPGAACHTDLTFSGLYKQFLMEDWAIDWLNDYLEMSLSDELQEIKNDVFVNNPQGWARLKMLDALHSLKKPLS